MNIFYKCRCMDAEGSFAVRDRREDEDIVEWMKGEVTPALGRDHATRSPLCRSDVTEYVKFEIDPSGAPLGAMNRQ